MTNPKVTLEEGDSCPECVGVLGYPEVRGCSCHINPPCSACVDNPLTCDKCGFEEDPPYPDGTPKPSKAQEDAWNKHRDDYEAARQRGHTFEHGGRIWDVDYDSRSGSTMVFRGRYEGPVTPADILDYLGDGTFGHRGPSLDRGLFTYTKITD